MSFCSVWLVRKKWGKNHPTKAKLFNLLKAKTKNIKTTIEFSTPKFFSEQEGPIWRQHTTHLLLIRSSSHYALQKMRSGCRRNIWIGGRRKRRPLLRAMSMKFEAAKGRRRRRRGWILESTENRAKLNEIRTLKKGKPEWKGVVSGEAVGRMGGF